jgi:hypothetical protein
MTVKPSQLRAFLGKTNPAKLPVLITGASGIGKSECEAQSSAEANADNIIMHPVVKDPTGSVLARHLGCRCVHA